MNVLVFVDIHNQKISKAGFEAAYYGAKIAQNNGGKAFALTIGNSPNNVLEELGKYGITTTYKAIEIINVEGNPIANALKETVAKTNANLVVFSHDNIGKAIAPMLAGKLQAGIVSGVIDFPDLTSGFKVKKAVFSGKAFAYYQITSPVKVISLLPNSIQFEPSTGNCQIEEISGNFGQGRVKVKEVKQKLGGGVSLPEAEIVVSAGRGMKGPENWQPIEELAQLLGAATACSRPVADIGWRPHHEHVGQTGIAIRPNLYIAIGISGAIQHLAGVNGSKVIVVINKDPEAPFFKAADYGIVGDAFDVLPKLIDAVKKFKAA